MPEKETTQSKKWEKDLNRHFSKEDIQMANKHMKRSSTSLFSREMQIKKPQWDITLVRTTIIKKSTNNKWGSGCGEKGILLHCWWECKLIQPLWKMVWRLLLKSRNKATTLRKPKLKKTHVSHCSLQHYLQQPEHGSNLERCPSTDEWIKKL